jgi:hypothetical protein
MHKEECDYSLVESYILHFIDFEVFEIVLVQV